jgi:hypothetical protein
MNSDLSQPVSELLQRVDAYWRAARSYLLVLKGKRCDAAIDLLRL